MACESSKDLQSRLAKLEKESTETYKFMRSTLANLENEMMEIKNIRNYLK